MNSETTITYVVAESSAQDSVGSTVMNLLVKDDPTECAEMADEFMADLRRRELTMTSTLEHILNDTDSAHELCMRH